MGGGKWLRLIFGLALLSLFLHTFMSAFRVYFSLDNGWLKGRSMQKIQSLLVLY